MRARRAGRVLAGATAVLVLAGCGEAAEQGSAVVDDLAERGAAAYAEGRWRCETDEDDGGDRRHIVTNVAIGANGRFSYDAEGDDDGPQVGTWTVEDLRLRLAVPWDDDGENGFYEWVHEADADPPTHLQGRRVGTNDGQELDVEIHEDRIRLVQHDVPGPGGPNYDWDVSCSRVSSDPGEIPPTVPASDGGGSSPPATSLLPPTSG